MSADNRSLTTADTMTATRRILAPPDSVFAVLADPRAHADIHGTDRVNEAVNSGRTGRVDGALDTERITGAGQLFLMAMYHEQHPNNNY